MANLTPLDIRKQSFKKVLRGFDPEEVQVFLEMVADYVDELLLQNQEMKEKLIQLEAVVEEYNKNEQNLNEMLEQTKNLQAETIANLKSKEENIIKEAELKAVEILENARNEARKVREEMRMMQEKKDAFVQRLKYLLQSYIDLIQMLGMENVVDIDSRNNELQQRERRNIPRKSTPPADSSSTQSLQTSEKEDFIEDISDIIENIDIPDDPMLENPRQNPPQKEDDGGENSQNIKNNTKAGE